MRRWSIIPWLLVGAGLAVPAAAHGVDRPLASHFDLSGYMVRSVSDGMNPEAKGMAAKDGPLRRWMLPDIAAAPPGPMQHEPSLRIRGRTVKFRMAF